MPDTPTGEQQTTAPPVVDDSGDVQVQTATPPVAQAQVQQEDRSVEGLTKALQAERQKRQAMESEIGKLKSAPARPEPNVPAIDWEKLLQPTQQQHQPQPQPQPQNQNGAANQLQQFVHGFGEAINSGDPALALQAVGAAYNVFRQLERMQEHQVRTVIPNYGDLPLHEVPDDLVATVQQNPTFLRAIIAMARSGNKPAQAAVQAVAEHQDTPEAIRQKAIDEERNRIQRLSQQAGITSEGPSSSGKGAEDTYELDPESTAFLKSLGRTPKEIADRAKAVAERQKQERFRNFFGYTA